MRAFGHNGSNCCIGWADPERRIAYAYLTGQIDGSRADISHQTTVADAVITAFA
jgi:CubicO group peptidase (beta-lactamase class C family)